MSASIPSPDGAVDNDHHDHHDHHTVGVADEAVVGDEVSGEPGPTPDVDPVAVVEAALVRLVDDVGVLAEDDVVRAFSILKATDLPSYLRLRHAAKKANRGCSVTVLDKLVRAELPASDDDASALDELVALARAQCQLHHDADRNAVAVIPMPNRREVWRVYSSGFEDWLRAAYWRAKEMGVPETTMKSALATLAAAGINDGDQIEIHVRAARCDDGYLIDLADEQWQAIHVTPQGWRVVNESPVYFTRTPSMRLLPMTEQIVAALSAPHLVQAVWDRIRASCPDLSEPEVVLQMRNLAGLWQQLFPAEQCRLAQLLIERVVIADGGLEIIWRDQGWQDLAGELMPGTIGAELQEWEQQEVEA